MPKDVVISQSMYFPWVGMLEQVRLANTFIHYDDVQFDRGFYNRVQVKTERGPRWLTVPLSNHRRGQKIYEIAIDDTSDWRRNHREVLRSAYRKAPHVEEMLGVVDAVFSRPIRTLSEVSRASFMALVDYFDLRGDRVFMDVLDMNVPGASSQRLLDIVQRVGGATYITGHGARNYLDHEAFEQAGVGVRYMKYELAPYPQLHGEFTPYVTSLDLIANCGKQGAAVIRSSTIDWKKFLGGPRAS
jgi:hypothetical protein